MNANCEFLILLSHFSHSYCLFIIGLDVKKFSHNLGDFRNYIHPEEQVTQNFNPDKNTALISYQVLLAAIKDLQNQKELIYK